MASRLALVNMLETMCLYAENTNQSQSFLFFSGEGHVCAAWAHVWQSEEGGRELFQHSPPQSFQTAAGRDLPDTDRTLELGWLPQATCLSPPPQQEHYKHLIPRLMQQARLLLAKVADT